MISCGAESSKLSSSFSKRHSARSSLFLYSCFAVPRLPTLAPIFLVLLTEDLMDTGKNVLVTGAGGFIGHHLVNRLKSDGFWVRGADVKYPEYESSAADEFEILDLKGCDNCLIAS